ncbi:MAG: DUF3310 domain-containing protein [Marichromatium sp.]|nr:DUF3310 domain-containing protein [Marichromatium sp.]
MKHASARDRQVGGDHYKKGVQPWDVIEAYGLSYWAGNAIKYICRDKIDRVEDLKKAVHYLEYEIERLQDRAQQRMAPTLTIPAGYDDPNNPD